VNPPTSEPSRKKTQITWIEGVPSEILEIKDHAIGKDTFKLITIGINLPQHAGEMSLVTLLLRGDQYNGLKTGVVARDIGFSEKDPEQPRLIHLENGVEAPIMN
jgi:hypothetical protein